MKSPLAAAKADLAAGDLLPLLKRREAAPIYEPDDLPRAGGGGCIFWRMGSLMGRTGKSGHLHRQHWRKGRDSNPRRAVNPHMLSRHAT